MFSEGEEDQRGPRQLEKVLRVSQAGMEGPWSRGEEPYWGPDSGEAGLAMRAPTNDEMNMMEIPASG